MAEKNNIRYIQEWDQPEDCVPLGEWFDPGLRYVILDPAIKVVREYSSNGERTGRIKLEKRQRDREDGKRKSEKGVFNNAS